MPDVDDPPQNCLRSISTRQDQFSFIAVGHKMSITTMALSRPVLPSTAATLSHSLFLRRPRRSTVLRFSFVCRRPRRRFPAVVSSHIMQDAAATATVLAGAYALVLSFDNLTRRELIQQNLSRKLVHILSGLLFTASWPIFSNSIEARYFAALVPLINCVRLIVYGLSLVTDEGLIKSVTRQGNPEELLRGPLYYVLILILCSLLFWRDSPIGLISLGMMCGGDGIADIIGRRFGLVKIPYNRQKSLAGSISMFVFGFLVSIGMLYYFSILGYFQLDWSCTMQRVALVSLIATLVESLPISELVDDNLSVPLVSMAVAYWSFGF